MGLTQADLKPTRTPLIGFSAEPVWPLGSIILPVRAGRVTKNTEFLVVDVPLAYNAIMGRTWLPRMKVIPSTYHQLLKFSGPKGTESIRGN